MKVYKVWKVVSMLGLPVPLELGWTEPIDHQYHDKERYRFCLSPMGHIFGDESKCVFLCVG